MALRRFRIEYQRSIALYWIKRRLLHKHVGYMLIAGMLQAFLLTGVCRAMDLTHYDLDSLVYLSTDIVVAIVSQSPEHGFSAVVTETIYGSLRPGDRVEQLSPFLSFFEPMQDGMRVILFLDRRPHQYDFLHSEAAKALFAVPPSGIYLIDEYGHVHEYYQQNNPGPYVAEGYSFFITKSVPSKEQDLALPTLDEKRAMIRASLKSVQTMRPLLDKSATHDDVPALFALLDRRADARHSCSLDEGGRDRRARQPADH